MKTWHVLATPKTTSNAGHVLTESHGFKKVLRTSHGFENSYLDLRELGVHPSEFMAVYSITKKELPGVDTIVWEKLLLMFAPRATMMPADEKLYDSLKSGVKPPDMELADWDGGWLAHRDEFLRIV